MMKFKSRLIAKTFNFLMLGLTTYFLTACQGSNIGSSLENAIAPASPSSSDAIAEKPNQPPPLATTPISSSPVSKPEAKSTNSPTSSVNSVNSDRLST
ncbi:MAG: hypothetical protein ACOVVP_02940, partial [Pseudanabaena sp.]